MKAMLQIVDRNRVRFFRWLFVISLLAQAQIAWSLKYFDDEQGHTNWQYVANWSSGILIILLSVSVGWLYITRRQLHSANNALLLNNEELEKRVAQRTVSLTKSNRLLEGEISRHEQTTKHLHASQAYVKSILESMPLMLVGLDDNGIVTQWNRGAERLTGLEAERIIGQALWETYPIIPVAQEEVNRALESRTTVMVHRSQRGQRHFDIVIYPIENTLETGCVLLIDDVTKQVLSMNQVIQKDKLSSMGELASSMAQDINFPLKNIITSIESAYHFVSERLHNNGMAIDAESIQVSLIAPLLKARNESYRAAAITNNLVDFAASHRHSKRPHDIIDLMEHALSLAAGIYSDTKGLKFNEILVKRCYEENLPLVLCNASELQQVFLSLLRHCCYALAEKYLARSTMAEHTTSEQGQASDEGEAVLPEAANSSVSEPVEYDWRPQITLTMLESYEVLWIKIQHNGIGLTSAEQHMIFEAYFNSTPVVGVPEDDQGLDADRRQSFSYFIITEHHKGQMAVTSDVDVGTTFHMELRLK